MRRNRMFLSHSWSDKPLARRVARGLEARGVEIWLDERRMRVGDALDVKLKAEIEKSRAFAVLLTQDAQKSRYVGLEIEAALAMDPLPAILPLSAEPGLLESRLEGHLHADLADPYRFEDRLDDIAEALGAEMTFSRKEHLERTLSAIATAHLDLSALAVAVRDDKELSFALDETLELRAEDYPALEELLWAATELHQADENAFYTLAYATAAVYLRTGAGLSVLRRALTHPKCEDTILQPLSRRHHKPETLHFTFQLFAEAGRPHDDAFTQFVRENFDTMSETQKRRAVQYALVPGRGPDGFMMDLAFALYERLPNNKALHRLWYFWINEHKIWTKIPFRQFAFWMARARHKGLAQFEPLIDHVRTCFRSTGRPEDLDALDRAVECLVAARDCAYTDLAGLTEQLKAGLGSAETEWMNGHPLERLYRKFVHAAPETEDFEGYEFRYALVEAIIEERDGKS